MQGQSEITEEKERGFASVFRQQMAVVKNSIHLRTGTYVHIDLHAGCGFNHDVGVVGSPILFRDIANDVGFESFLMFAVEKDRSRIQELGNRLADCDRCFPLFGDNSEACYCMPDILRSNGIEPRNAIGSILIDPNGFTKQIPWESLMKLLSICGRIDVVFNFPGTAYTRNRGHDEYVHIDELPMRLNKKFWYIRKPLPTHKFTLCVGRNTDKLNIPKKLGLPFALWDSDEGKKYRNKAMMTDEEIARMPCSGQMEFGFV